MDFLFLLAFITLVHSEITNHIKFEPLDFIDDESWLIWKSMHNKMYVDLGQEKVRYNIWRDNFNRIIEHNKKNKGFVLGMNHLGDLTTIEFKALMNGFLYNPNLEQNGPNFVPSPGTIPTGIDWRTRGAVTPVKNQGQCGSCWSFSTTGALEGQQWKKTGKLLSLSEQNLVDCSTRFGNNGCHGGIMDNAFRYIKQNGGVDTEASYPYEGQELECRFDPKNVGATDTGFLDILRGNETALEYALATVGPVSVAIDASHFSFQFYRAGVYDEAECSPQNLDHGVLAVGYGEDEHGQQYWIVKNSWSERWGEDGYIKMSRNKDNQCGIASMASFPLV